MEHCHHPSIHMISQMAMEEPCARVVCVSVKHKHAAALHNHLINMVPRVVENNAMPMGCVDSIFITKGSDIPPGPAHTRAEARQEDTGLLGAWYGAPDASGCNMSNCDSSASSHWPLLPVLDAGCKS